jgi:iron complex outermembrane receptor protein
MSRTNLLSSACIFAFAAIATPAAAQQAPADETANADDQQQISQTSNEDVTKDDKKIVVTASFVEELNLLAGTSVITGDALTREIDPQIGEILTKLPGVSATSFTPGASRPVLRGFQGPRVLVLNDGLGLVDVSTTSPDHAVTVEPLLLDRIEVLRGPAVLLFGGGAIGGAVNTIDKRIPRTVPEDDINLDLLGTFASAADEVGISGSVDVPLTSNLVFHLDGSFRDSGNVSIGGNVLSPALQEQQLEVAAEATAEGDLEAAEEALEFAALSGEIPNTQTETLSFGGGLSWIGDSASFGFAVSYLDSDYGVGVNPNGEEEEEEGGEEEGGEEEEGSGVTIALEQIKVDFRGDINLDGFFDSLRLRASYADFQQIEFEAPGEQGTVFDNEGIEARAELVQAEQNGWRGASGIQYSYRDFSAIGAEAFVPPNETSQFGIFTLQEAKIGNVDIEGALRLDFVDSESQIIGVDRSFTSFSAAIGLGYNLAENVKIGANIARAERAPSPEELFSNGPHLATSTFEIGNPNFDTETSYGGELYFRVDQPGWEFAVTGYFNSVDDFIIELPTGEIEDGLPVFQFIQNDAEYYGVEVEASVELGKAADFTFVADGVFDFVRASLDGLGNVPRIPPLRLLGGLEAQSDTLNGRVEVEWFDDQDRTAAFETPTDGFTFVNASVAWKPLGADGNLTLLASANNIFDTVGRRAASFTKDFIPLAGRDFRVSAKVSF